MKLPANIILVGFMGAGKTTTGKELAHLLGFNFLDMDQMIEEKNGKEIKKIFEENGEEYFRNQEKEMIKTLELKEKMVISTGGGAWLSEGNREKLSKTGWCVWLKVSPEKAIQRLGANLSKRPLLTSIDEPIKKIESLLLERNNIYSKANITVDTDDKKPKEVAMEIIKMIKEDPRFDLRTL